MCPVCIATAVWIAAGATSTGGISALVVGTLRRKNHETPANNKNHIQGERDGQE